ncbi:dehydrogenase/reductase SDR family member 7B-like [Littorina saxatilis]|uniref:Ketoreductase domain-containing protein n=1 Tax=Littorina saxatilis TaxID=31220 RepID=A0AAN9BT50_9CAEN
MLLSLQSVSGGLVSVGVLYCILSLLKRGKKVNIKGKVVLITGASSGLGEACAKVFHSQGCRVILAGRSEERLNAVKRALLKSKISPVKDYQEPAILKLDLEDLNSLHEKGRQALHLFGGVDILINNAGISYRGCIQDTTIDVDQKLMTVNYFGHVAFIKALLPAMLSQKSGHIVGISSVQGKMSIPYRSAYSASKHALQAFFDCLRAELADTCVSVSVLSPGYIRTNLSTSAVCGDGSVHGVMDKTTESGMAAEAVAERVLRSVLYRQPEEIIAPLHHHLAVILRVVAPQVFFTIMAKRARKQRKDYVKHD